MARLSTFWFLFLAAMLLTGSNSFAGGYAYVNFQQALNQCTAGSKAKQVIAVLPQDEKRKADDIYTQHIVAALLATTKAIYAEGSYQAIFQQSTSEAPEMVAGTYRQPYTREGAIDLTLALIEQINQNHSYLDTLLDKTPYVDAGAAMLKIPMHAVALRDESGLKVGFVDLQKALNLSSAGVEAKKIISGIVAAKESEIADRQATIEKMKVANDGRFQAEVETFKDFTTKVQNDLQSLDAKFTKFLVEGLVDEINSMFKESGGYSAILEADMKQVVTGVKTVSVAKEDAIDLTEQLLKRFNLNRSYVDTIKSFSETVVSVAAKGGRENQPENNASVKRQSDIVAADTAPPIVQISSPQVSRGIGMTVRNNNLLVIGTATDISGVAYVTVNGQQAALDAQGNFSAEILLKVGDNTVKVVASDVHRNVTKEVFTLMREVVASDALPNPLAVGGRYYALIIGNNDYQYLSKLQTAVNDATEVDRLLRGAYGFQTKLLLNAGRKDILSALNDFRKRLGTNDHLLIYYAGHGEFDRTADKAYWLPVDAMKDDPADWIIADSITASIRRLSSRHVLIVSDSCYSGTLTRSAQTNLQNRSERDQYLRKMSDRSSRTLMASGGNEPVADGGGTGHSIFADSFIKALSRIENTTFTADELFFQHIRSQVAGRSDQLPEYNELRNSGHDGGDFIFVRQ